VCDPSTRLPPPKKIHHVNPPMPDGARSSRQGGQVIMDTIIGTSGDVLAIRVVRGDPVFNLSAVRTVAQWKYEPYVLRQVPTPVHMFVSTSYNFR
jgi:TonB family protein